MTTLTHLTELEYLRLLARDQEILLRETPPQEVERRAEERGLVKQ